MASAASLLIYLGMKTPFHVLRPFDLYYPKHLLQCWGENIYVLGNYELLQQKTPSVVGSRDICVPVKQWFDRHLTQFLEMSKAVVASGAAHGVDQAAHALSVRCTLPAIAVLPSGFRHIYPNTFRP